MKHANLVNAIMAAGYSVISEDHCDYHARNGQAFVWWRTIDGKVIILEAEYNDPGKRYNFHVPMPKPKSLKEVAHFLNSGSYPIDRVAKEVGNNRELIFDEFYEKLNDLYEFMAVDVAEMYFFSDEREKRILESADLLKKILKDVGRICVEQDKEDEKNAD